MKITEADQTYDFIPIKQFRAVYDLPPTFGVAMFEPKDFTGLAALDQSGQLLKQLQRAVMKAIPEHITTPTLLSVVDDLRTTFRQELEAINKSIGLRPPEVDFAVAGFGDVLMAWAYTLISQREGANFVAVYHQWLQDSLRLSQTVHTYTHDDAIWRIQVVNNVYGRVGLRVEGEHITYVQDTLYACPAQGFMATLLTDVANQTRTHFQS